MCRGGGAEVVVQNRSAGRHFAYVSSAKATPRQFLVFSQSKIRIYPFLTSDNNLSKATHDVSVIITGSHFPCFPVIVFQNPTLTP
jgi:hypothetical protein